MSATINLFDARSATDLVNKQISPEAFIADKIFSRTKDHVATKIDLEIVASDGKRLAPFINRGDAAKQINKRTRKGVTITLPEVALEQFFTPEDLYTHVSPIGGSLYVPNAGPLMAYRNQTLAESSQDLKDRITRLREWMAAKALQGKITVSQDDISFEFDMGFITDIHNVTLTGTARWNQSTATIVKNIRAYKRQTQQRCGFVADTCLLGTTAAESFIASAEIQAMLDKNNIKVGVMDLNQEQGQAATYLGRILGIDFWEYSQQYKDAADADQDYIPAVNAIFVASKSPGLRTHWGPVIRNDGVHTERFYSRTEETKRPDGFAQEVAASFAPIVHDADAVVNVVTQ